MNKLIQTLQQEEDKLLNKLQKANNENNFGDYKMLIRTLTEVSRLKNDEIKANKVSYNRKSFLLTLVDPNDKVGDFENKYLTSIFNKNINKTYNNGDLNNQYGYIIFDFDDIVLIELYDNVYNSDLYRAIEKYNIKNLVFIEDKIKMTEEHKKYLNDYLIPYDVKLINRYEHLGINKSK